MTSIVLGLLLAVSTPLLLLPLEKVFPLPYLLEEVTKLLIVLVMIRSEKVKDGRFFLWIVAAGLLFTLSETILYATNMFALGSFDPLPVRLISTGILHVTTFLILYFCARKGWLFLVLGLLLAILVHYAYNLWIGEVYVSMV